MIECRIVTINIIEEYMNKAFMASLSVVGLLSATLSGCATGPEISPSGMVVCAPGGNGGGGTYRFGAATCEDGAIVSNGFRLCKKGENGDGGVFRPEAGTCDNGAIVPTGFNYCKKGANGGGGIYNSALARCSSGQIY